MRAAQLKLDTERKFLSDAQAKLAAATTRKRNADAAVEKYLSDVSRYTPTTGSTTTTIITGGISGTASSSTSSSSNPRVYVYGVNPTSIGSISDYLVRIYGQSNSKYLSSYTSPASVYSTMYPLSITTLNALYGNSAAGIFLPSGSSSYLSGISSSVIGTSSLPSNVVSDFSCSSSSNDLISGYGKVTSVQPGYITVDTPSRGSINLRIGGCSRMESNRPNFVASTSDSVFFRGKAGLSKDIHLYDLTCLSWLWLVFRIYLSIFLFYLYYFVIKLNSE